MHCYSIQIQYFTLLIYIIIFIILIFRTLNIRINGGAHNKRHLLQPLEIDILEMLLHLKSFFEIYISNTRGYSVATQKKFKAFNIKGLISYSYHK